ncbi:MAG: bifunctional phosphoribosyl-AMP cyclohydrolase/phosphoribosyl-ATP diphosphatase HisIE [Bacteroidaceae bacterium]|nr:bifunctional phosphoribosyl-AMP cyclohydrolase/phosphoribosyl-ATP diphosphatase HisIE [Bacteroidaceae bacterium]MBR3613349.1 bifunctional phosphoribosyl-AMP cyclohydrolase/phosphoribosyl-ATP diphosphatase HisIE [Bacteroidaceae bacterium]
MNFSDFDLSKNSDGLLPVVVQDSATLKVLMVAYMNREAFEKTVETGKATFYSRSRKALWTKGETSGNFIEVVQMYPDCDNDTLLIMGKPYGPACHRGTTACFDTPETEGFIRKLEKVIQGRHAAMPEGSYTTHLFNKGVNKIAQKVGEEAVETVIEAIDGNKERYLYEACDLVYHLLVLNEQMGFTLQDMERELADRHS